MDEEKKYIETWTITNERFIVFLDIMGFKDFVARKSHTEVYDMMVQLSGSKSYVNEMFSNVNTPIYKDKELYTASFSDSIILFSNDNSAESLDIIAASAAYILHDSILNDIPMKGSIAMGKISVNKEQQIYFGQPLIDSFLLQEEVNYYGIVAHNSIDAYLQKLDPEMPAVKLFFEVKTPMKTGKITHNNIDWFYFLGNYKNSNTEEKREKLKYYLDSLKKLVSGAPRKYIDNTFEVFESAYPTK